MNDDTISRRAAIDRINKQREHLQPDIYPQDKIGDAAYRICAEFIERLPSAQPKIEERKEESAQNVPKEDLISRNAAIDAVEIFLKQTDAPEVYPGLIPALARVINNVPSAQPEPIRINLNEPIKVKLTDLGKEIYYHQYDRTNQIAGREICKPRFPREDENGYTEFQLWCFIELYGMHMGMTLPNVIEPLEIVYER